MPKISEYPTTDFPSLEHEFPASRAGETHKLRLRQVRDIMEFDASEISFEQTNVGSSLQALQTGKANLSDFLLLANAFNNARWDTAQIADNAIETPKIRDGAVTGPKVPDGAFSLAKLINFTGPIIVGRSSGTGPLMPLSMDALWNMIAGQSGDFGPSGAIVLPINVLGIRRSLIYQWGTLLGATADYVVNFPMQFPNGLLKPQTQMFSSGAGLNAVTCNVESVSTSSFTVRRRLISNGGTVTTTTIGGYWDAVGF
ncbi:hypothetical protein FPY71_10000 [Aureimonas fodinaquatilis]|uniref:Putative tail fiber protein gp53-like C-terminal domain-containing protein n=1 Tax=Aureimonas fodinaquatilis TaxID=2565783 RepID=A0A5B0DWR0_9HYPH|nr:hypothetical protein [Aureimonas fodinaquatilis]KAA0970798.1 hypothetical protein FPY71_10000 [Aureimonas fodinaquatilis]